MSKLPKRKCKGCGKMFQPMQHNQWFHSPECRKAWEQRKVEVTCCVCGGTYKAKNVSIERAKAAGRSPLCYSCCASGGMAMKLPQTYLRTCHTPGCNNKTTQYWCDECKAKRQAELDNCGGNADFTGVSPSGLQRSFTL